MDIHINNPDIRAGENNPNWRGGRFKSHGYVRVSAPNHPRAFANGYVLEHILVWENVHNKSLPGKELR